MLIDTQFAEQIGALLTVMGVSPRPPRRPRGEVAAAEACSGKPRTQSAGLARSLDEGVELGGRDLEIVAHGVVRVVHEATEGREILLSQRPDRFEDPGVLKDNVASALELFALEPGQVLLPGVPELPHA